jgi:hypothetical protein
MNSSHTFAPLTLRCNVRLGMSLERHPRKIVNLSRRQIQRDHRFRSCLQAATQSREKSGSSVRPPSGLLGGACATEAPVDAGASCQHCSCAEP